MSDLLDLGDWQICEMYEVVNERECLWTYERLFQKTEYDDECDMTNREN